MVISLYEDEKLLKILVVRSLQRSHHQLLLSHSLIVFRVKAVPITFGCLIAIGPITNGCLNHFRNRRSLGNFYGENSHSEPVVRFESVSLLHFNATQLFQPLSQC